MQFERELWEQKAEFDKCREKEKAAEQKAAIAAKLPKLTITKFDGRIEESMAPFLG